jgi:hypothetical protein
MEKCGTVISTNGIGGCTAGLVPYHVSSSRADLYSLGVQIDLFFKPAH